MKKHIYKIATTLSSFALLIAMFADGARSTIIYHQPKVPTALDKFKK